MTTITAGRWLLVALAIVGLAVVAPVVSAHGTDTKTDHPHDGVDVAPRDSTSGEWNQWVVSHMGSAFDEMMAYMTHGIDAVTHSWGDSGDYRGGNGMHGSGHATGHGALGEDTHGVGHRTPAGSYGC